MAILDPNQLDFFLSSLPSSALAKKVATYMYRYARESGGDGGVQVSTLELDILSSYMNERVVWDGHTRGGSLGLIPMGIEIERKFLIPSTDVLPGFHVDLPHDTMVQGYLGKGSGAVRVRIVTPGCFDSPVKAFLTLKGKGKKVRSEYEYVIPVKDALEMLSTMASCFVSKVRYYLRYEHGPILEVDVFQEDRKGLVLVEVEFQDLEESDLYVPSFPCKEVTEDRRFSNYQIALEDPLPSKKSKKNKKKDSK